MLLKILNIIITLFSLFLLTPVTIRGQEVIFIDEFETGLTHWQLNGSTSNFSNPSPGYFSVNAVQISHQPDTANAGIYQRINNGGWQDWSNIASSLWIINNDSGSFTSFSGAYNLNNVYSQTVIRNGKVFQRTQNPNWSPWAEINFSFDTVGTGIITGFCQYTNNISTPYLVQNLTRNGQVYERNNQTGWPDNWTNITTAFNNVGDGTITSFCTSITNNKYHQHLVRNHILYKREKQIDPPNNWTNWQIENLNTVGVGNITSFSMHHLPNGNLSQYLVRQPHSTSAVYNPQLTKQFTSQTNQNFSIMFYDDLQNHNNYLSIGNNTQSLRLGTMTSCPNHYALHFSTDNSHICTNIARSHGWNLLELITTNQGTYPKINNHFLVHNNIAPYKVVINDATFIKIGSYGNSLSQGKFDRAKILGQDNRPWPEQITTTLGEYYNTYKDTNFQISKPYAGNTLRSLANTASTFYIYGLATNNQSAKDRAVNIFTDALTHHDINSTDYGIKGVVISSLVNAAHYLRSDLNQSTHDQLQTIISDQATQFLSDKSLQLNTSSGNDSVVLTYEFPQPITIQPQDQVFYFRFKDDLQPKAMLIGLYNQDETDGMIFGVNSNISNSHYIYRQHVNQASQITPIARQQGNFNIRFILASTGLHTFIYNDQPLGPHNPTITSVAKIKVAIPNWISNPSEVIINSIRHPFGVENFNQTLANWTITKTDNAQTTLTPVYNTLSTPKSGHVGDTKAEDNAWNTLAMATMRNFSPT